MRPSRTDRGAGQSARDVRPQPGVPPRPRDRTDRRQRAPSSDTREPVGGAQSMSDPTDPDYGEPTGSIRGTDSRRRPLAEKYGSPHGHVVGHEIGEPPPRRRDPNRPFGRIGPYGL